MLDEHRLGHHGAGAAGTGESGNGRQHMQKQDAQITHRRILIWNDLSSQLDLRTKSKSRIEGGRGGDCDG
jgi:hypothetical protein